MIQAPGKNLKSAERLRRAPLLGICVAFFFVFAVCVVGLWNDLNNRSKLILSSEVSNLESHVERSVIRIEADLRDGNSLEDFATPNVAPWLTDHWARLITPQPNRLYACVEDASGSMLSYGGRINLNEEKPTRREQIDGFPKFVTRVKFGLPPDSMAAVEVALPIEVKDRRIGTYRTAIPADWISAKIANATRSRWIVWLAILIALGLIVSITAFFLFRLGAHTRDLEQALQTSETRRLADLSKLVVSMAHELRNPLNSIRLNLFTSEKFIRGDSQMDQQDALVMIHESVSEIERVNELIGQLLGFVKADDAQESWLNLDNEIQSILQFLKPTHDHHGIEIEYLSVQSSSIGKVSRKYFRQILINLLQNARQAMPQGGCIRLDLRSDAQLVILSVEDSGPGVPANLFERIFEPFYSTHQEGAGLGLAVVRNLIEATGGSVSCQRSSSLGGLKFTLRFHAKPTSIATAQNYS